MRGIHVLVRLFPRVIVFTLEYNSVFNDVLAPPVLIKMLIQILIISEHHNGERLFLAYGSTELNMALKERRIKTNCLWLEYKT